MGALTLDAKAYGRLLARAVPKVIETPRDHARLLGEIERLMDRGEERTREEDALLRLLAALVRDYEDEHFPVPDPTPQQALRFLMDKGGLRQADLVPVLGSSGTVSEIVHGRREISKAQAKRLAEFFHLSAELFI